MDHWISQYKSNDTDGIGQWLLFVSHQVCINCLKKKYPGHWLDFFKQWSWYWFEISLCILIYCSRFPSLPRLWFSFILHVQEIKMAQS